MTAQKRPIRADKLRTLPVGRLERGRLQPRRAIDAAALKKLAESVRSNGVVQPLFVRRIAGGKFEIVAGERRWRAAKMAGLKKVPTVVRDVSDETALTIALLENLHREELNPIDQAYAVRHLIETFSMTHREVAEAVGKSRVTVTNLLRLLDLPEEVTAMLADGKLDLGHARALLSLSPDRQLAAARRVVAGDMSVRDVERMVKDSCIGAPGSAAADKEDEKETLPETESAWLRRCLARELGRGIRIKRRKGGGLCLKITVADLQELRGVLGAIADMLRGLEPVESVREKGGG